MKWNLEWLRTFKAIYETGTLSAAAQELFISQPGVSLHLNSWKHLRGTSFLIALREEWCRPKRGKSCITMLLIRLKN